MGTVVSEGGPRQQQGEEEDPQPAPLHLTAHPTLPLSLLAVAQSYRGMCFSAQLCNVKGAALFSIYSLSGVTSQIPDNRVKYENIPKLG